MKILVTAFKEVFYNIYYIVLMLIVCLGSAINYLGQRLSALGQLLMKVDPLR